MLIKMLTCDFCDRTFKNGRSLSSHKYSFHQQNPSKDTIAFVSDPSDQNQGKYRSSEWNNILNSSPAVSDDDSDDSSGSGATIYSDEYPNSFQPNMDIRKHQSASRSGSTDEEQPAKLSKLEPRKKRYTIRGKDPRFNSNNKRVYVSDTDDEELEKKRYRRSDREPSTHSTRFQDRLLALKLSREKSETLIKS